MFIFYLYKKGENRKGKWGKNKDQTKKLFIFYLRFQNVTLIVTYYLQLYNTLTLNTLELIVSWLRNYEYN